MLVICSPCAAANDFPNRVAPLGKPRSNLRIYDTLMGSLFISTSASRRREKLPCVYNIHKSYSQSCPKFILLRQTFPFSIQIPTRGWEDALSAFLALLCSPRGHDQVPDAHHTLALSAPLSSPSPQPIFTPLLQLGSILDRLTYWKKFGNVLSLTEGLPKVSKNFLEACRYSCAARVCRAEWSGEENSNPPAPREASYIMKQEWKPKEPRV